MAFNNAINAKQQGTQYQSSTGSWTGIDAGTAGNVLTSNGTGVAPSFQAPAGASTPAGALQYFSTSGGTSISGWLPCDGSVVSQATYPSLFTAVGLINGPGTVWTSTTIPYYTNFGSGGLSSLNQNLKYLNGNYVGNGGVNGFNQIITSTDALTWTYRKTGTTSICRCFGFGNSLYVAGTVGGFFTSTNLSSWTYTTVATLASTSTVNSVIYGNSKFVFTTNNGSIGTSTDGVTFALVPAAPFPISDITFGGSLFVGVGNFRSVVTSTDGVTFDTTTPNITKGNALGPILAYGDKFVMCGGGANYALMCTSTDFTTWTFRNASQTTSSTLNCIVYVNSLYLSAGVGGILSTSTDAITWTSRTSGTSSNINALTFGSIYVYAGDGGALATSTDAITWTSRTSGTSSNINALTFGSLYVYAGAGGVLRSSTDAITWDLRTSGTSSAIRGLAYSSGLGLYCFVGTSGIISTSTDAITWNSRTSPTTTDLSVVVFKNNLFIAGGSVGTIVTSTDGVTWTLRDTPLGSTGNGIPNILGIEFVSGTYYAYSGYTSSGASMGLTSTDAITWSLLPTQTHLSYNTGTATGVIYANSKYYSVDNLGFVGTSTDAKTWSYASTGYNVVGNTCIAFGDSLFLINTFQTSAGAAFSQLMSSTDAITWNQVNISSDPAPFLFNLTYGTRFVGFGTTVNGGALAQYPAKIFMTNTTYSYDTATQFQLPKQLKPLQTLEVNTNFLQQLYIKT